MPPYIHREWRERGELKMKSLFITLVAFAALLLMPSLANAQSDQQTTAPPPISQPLVREGTLATKLADVLKVGTPANESEAESALTAVGIAPHNGWIADYPVTPDIAGELRNAISYAADTKAIAMSKDDALKAFEGVVQQYNLPAGTDTSGQAVNEPSGESYPDTTVISNYYYDQGPPVVTYYAPPPDYAYLYSWVPYPFWWWDFWFPGFFVLADFDFRIGGHGHGHGHGHDEFVSNHFRDHRTGRMSRIDPANRSHGGTFADRGGSQWSSPSGQRGAAAIVNSSRNLTAGRNNRTFIAPSRNGRTATLSSRKGTSVLHSGGRNTISTVRSGRTYGGSSNYYGGRSYNRPAYRSPYLGSRSFNSPSGGWRTFNKTSAGSRGFGATGGNRGPFGGGSGGSFGGGMRR